MTFDDLKQVLEAEIDRIPSGAVPLNVAESLAIKFEKLRSKCANAELSLRMDKANLSAVMRLTKKQAYLNAAGSNATIKKLNAEANEDCVEQEKELDIVSSKLKYLETMQSVCGNYHVFFRQLSK